MGSPIQALLEVSSLKQSGELIGYGLTDAIMTNVGLGLYQKEGINSALLRVVDLDTQHPIRFDPEGNSSNMSEVWECIKDGRMFLYFDNYELVALITKTLESKFIFLKQTVYRAYLSTPYTQILTSEPTTDIETALGWIERRVKKCFEVFPRLEKQE